MCMKCLLKYSFFLNICFKFLTTVWSCPHYHGYTANSNHPHGATTTFIPIPIGLPRQISPILWYYGSNHSTTAILIPCQSLSLTAKTSWTHTTWLINQNSILHCMLVQCSVVAWKHHWDAQWWRWCKSDIQSSVWNCANILKTFGSRHKTSCLSSTFAPLLVETTPSVVTLLMKLQKNFTKCIHKLRKLASN